MTDSPSSTASLAAAPVLSVLPGTGLTFDAATGEIALTPQGLTTGADLVIASTTAGVAGPSWRVSIAALAPDPGVTLDFTAATAEDLANVTFLGTGALSWSLGDGFARLVPATSARAHGAWTAGGGDGLYRCLFRIQGGLPAAIDRRFTFGARVRFAGGNWDGIRVEPFETSAGKRYLHIREYNGVSGATTSLATTAIAWDYDVWQWLEVNLAGTAVSGRIYAEGAEAPDWQVSAAIHQVEPGAFGPGAFPAGGVAPTIDIRRLTFVPAA